MKGFQRYGLACLAFGCAAGLMVSTPSAFADDEKKEVTEKRTTTTTSQYEYYPESEVYFVPEKRVYYWESDGTWRSAPEAPSGVVLGRKVILKDEQGEPWSRHEIIVKKHGGRQNREKVTTTEEKVIEKKEIEEDDDD